MMALIDEKERNWAEREQAYQRQIVESRDMVKELKVSQEHCVCSSKRTRSEIRYVPSCTLSDCR